VVVKINSVQQAEFSDLFNPEEVRFWLNDKVVSGDLSTLRVA
jgi:hypothetical protein